MNRMKKIISASLVAGMLAAAAVPAGATYFSDIAIGHWGRDGVNYAADNGYIGYSGTKFDPYNSITRAEVALMLYKFRCGKCDFAV